MVFFYNKYIKIQFNFINFIYSLYILKNKFLNFFLIFYKWEFIISIHGYKNDIQ